MAGAVVPSVGMVTKHTGTPASAKTRAASMPSVSCSKGEMVPMRSLRTGRRRSSAALPAMTVAISTAQRAWRAPMTMPCRCLTVLAKPTSSSCSWAVWAQSAAETVGHQKLRPGR